MNHTSAGAWRGRAVCRSVLLVILLPGCLPTSEPAAVGEESAELRFDEPKYRGVCWVDGRRPVEEQGFLPLVENHVDWIVQTPFAW